MGLIFPMLAAFAIAIGLAWLFGGQKGPEAFGKAMRRGGAGALIAIGAVLSLTGKVFIGIPLIGFGLSIWRPGLLEPRPTLVDGKIIAGRFAGRTLDALSREELVVLYADLAGRRRDRSILEAHLDRRIPGWRENFQRDSAGRAGNATGPGAMTKEQAYQILGLAPGATEAEISTAYRRLMKRVHPDQGGSTFLAIQINEAKERLLGRHR